MMFLFCIKIKYTLRKQLAYFRKELLIILHVGWELVLRIQKKSNTSENMLKLFKQSKLIGITSFKN